MCTPWTLCQFIVGHQPKAGHHKPLNTRNPLEDETNNPVFKPSGQSNNAQPSSSPRIDRTSNEPGSRMSLMKRGKHKRKVTIGSNHTSSSSSSLGDVDDGANVNDTDWPPFTDEDYIVFRVEENGEFHLVMDENLQSQDHCFEIGHSPRPFNQKDQGDNDGIKRREHCNLDEEGDALSEDDDLECHETSMQCGDGSVESAGSSQPDWVRHLQVTKTDQEIGLSSPSLSPSKKGKLITLMCKEGEDEESVYLSSESQQGGSQGGDDDEQSNKEESAETSNTNDLEEDQEAALGSAKSKGRIGSSSSFEFPVLQRDWIGSPVKWPKSKSTRLRKHKSSQVGLSCCR